MNVSARIINTLYDFIKGAELRGALTHDLAFLKLADLDRLLLLSHSLGGFVAFKVLTGKLKMPLRHITRAEGSINEDVGILRSKFLL